MVDYDAGRAVLTFLPKLSRDFNQQLKAQLAGVDNDFAVNVKVEVDERGLAGLRAALNSLPTIVLDVDATAADREIEALRARIAELSGKTIGIDISGEQARREVTALKADLDRLGAASPDIGVRVDAGAASAALDRVNHDISQVDGRRVTANVNVDVAGALQSLASLALALNAVDGHKVSGSVLIDTAQSIAGVALLATKLFAIGGAAGAISSVVAAVGALGPAAAVAGGGIAAMVLGFGGVGKALSALSAQQDSAGQSAQQQAKQQQSAAFAITNAQSSLSQATARASQARSDGARSVEKAETDSARSIVSAQQQVDSAQRSLTQASQAAAKARVDAARSVQKAEEQANDSIASAERSAQQAHRSLGQATADLRREQDQLTYAWEDGRRQLEDLQDQLDMGVIDQRQAALDLADAKADLSKAQASGDKTAIAKAQIAYDRQIETIDELNKRVMRLRMDNDTAAATGVEGSQAVVAANQRIASSQQSVDDATRGAQQADAALSKARVDGAASVADAQRAAQASIESADERVQSAKIARDAAQAGLDQAREDRISKIADAQTAANKSIADADQSVINAQRALQQAMSQTGDAGQSAADKVKTAFANLSPAAASFAMYLWSLKPALDALRATAAAGLFPPLQAGLATLMTQFSVFQTVIGQFAAAIGAALGYVLAQLASPFWTGFFSALGAVAGPILMQLAVVFMQIAQAVGGLILALLPFTPAAVSMLGLVAALIGAWTPFIAMFVGQLLPVFGMLLQALMPLGPVIGALSPILAVLGQAFSMVLGAALQALAPILVALTPLIQALAMAFAQQLVASIQAATPFLVGLATFMSAHPALVMGVISALGGLFSIWGLLKSIVGALLGPLMLLRIGMWALGVSAASIGGVFGEALASFAGFLRTLLGGTPVFTLIRTLLGFVGGAIREIGGSILGALGPIGWIIMIFGVLFASSEQFRGAVMGLLGVLGQVVGMLVGALMPVFQALMGVVNMIMGVFGQLLAQLAAALVPVLNMLAGVVMQLAMALLPPLVSIVNALLPVFGLLGQIVGVLFQALQPILGVFTQLISAILPVLVGIIQSVVVPVISFLAQLFAAELGMVLNYIIVPALQLVVWVLTNLLVPAITWLASLVGPALSGIGFVMTWLWQSVFVPAWNAIAAAFTWAWVNIIQPVVGFIWTALQYLGAILFVILVAPFLIAWNLISAAVSWAWTNVLQPIWNGIVWFIGNVLAPIFTWLYTNVILPIWNAIGAAISWVWNSIILPVWNAIVWYINNVTIPVMNFLYYNVILPIWNAIGAAISWVWNYIILPQWNALVWVINNVLIPAMNFLYYNVIKPVWDAIGAAISFVWTNVISPAFNAVWGGLQWLGQRFQDGVGFIQRVWDGIRGILARPINFMINTVWNGGILAAWNKVAGLLGIPAIGPLAPIPEMATGGAVDATGGGMLSGPGTPTSDSILARLSTKEFVVQAAVAQQVPHFLTALNSNQPEAIQAAGGVKARMPGFGKPNMTDRGGGPIPFYAGGGWVTLPRFVDGGPVERAKAFAQSQNGKPYQWGGVGNPSFDCSGFTSAITCVLRGEPIRRLGVAASNPWPGFQPGLGGAWSVGASSEHTAGTLGGVNVESGGPHNNVAFGGPAVGADNGQFPVKAWLPQIGGEFVSGGQGGGGSWFNPLPGLVRAAFALTDIPLAGLHALVGDPPPEYRRVPVGLATKIRDSMRDFLVQKAELSGGGGGGPAPPGQVNDWIMQALGILRFPPNFAAGLFQQIMTESSGNPGAVQGNIGDVNNRSGDLAKGIMQVIGATFARWAMPGHGDIFNPVDNIIAGSRYAMAKYGPGWFSPGPQHSHGYDSGGVGQGIGWMWKGTNLDERVLDPVETQAYPTLTRLSQQLEAGRVPTDSLTNATSGVRSAALAGAPGTTSSGDDRALVAHLYDTDGVLLGTIRGAVDSSMTELAAAINDGSS